MSQHWASADCHGRKAVVMAGYDRPLNTLFLQVWAEQASGSPATDEVLYSSLQEPQCDWTDINVLPAKLDELGITVPDSLLEAVYLDQLFHVGNRVVRHQAGQPAEILLAG